MKYLPAFLLITCFSISVLSQESAIIPNIASQRELFIDDYLFDRMYQSQLVLHHPVDRGPVFYFDKPWEGNLCAYCTIIKDSSMYRAYYRGIPIAGADNSTAETTCVAESKDGIVWSKPDLGIYKVKGTRDNNVILAEAEPITHNFSPMLDTRPGVHSSERYKALGGNVHSGLIALKSSDGIHWVKLQEEPVMTDGVFDSQNVAFWSESEQCYVAYFRSWSASTEKNKFQGYRTISRATSKDFINWTESVAMDFGDSPMEQLYTNQTGPYFRAPHIYVAIAARFMNGRTVLTEAEAKSLQLTPLKFHKDCSEAVLMTSRGGNSYDRTFMEGFIPPGIGLNNWTSRTNYPALNVVQTGPAEMSVYTNQDYGQPTAHLHRYSMRLDGFASVYAPYEGGELITKPFNFTGDQLYLNFATSAAGGIRVEIQDMDGKPIEGYTLFDCKEVIGNEIDRAVVWENEENCLNDLAGKPVRLRFVFKDAHIYSLQFRDSGS